MNLVTQVELQSEQDPEIFLFFFYVCEQQLVVVVD